jgi:hypothetical protein
MGIISRCAITDVHLMRKTSGCLDSLSRRFAALDVCLEDRQIGGVAATSSDAVSSPTVQARQTVLKYRLALFVEAEQPFCIGRVTAMGAQTTNVGPLFRDDLAASHRVAHCHFQPSFTHAAQ